MRNETPMGLELFFFRGVQPLGGVIFILMGSGGGPLFGSLNLTKFIYIYIYIYCSLGIYLIGHKRNPCTNILIGFKI